MKQIILIVFLAISINTFGQTNYSKEQFDQYKRYKSIEHHFSPVHKSIFTLENGKIIFSDNYTKDEYRSRQKYSYDSKNDLIRSETIYFKDHTASNYDDLLIPTIFTYTYDDKNRLIEVSTKEQNYPPSSEIYSDFNELNLPQKKQIVGYNVSEYSYDEKGRKVKEKETCDVLDRIEIEIIEYQYDKYDNVISLKRTLIPEQKFPIEVMGGRFRYEVEQFRYVYNKYGLWTKKFWTVEGKERLIEKRKFKK